jgi:TPR repeat protein
VKAKLRIFRTFDPKNLTLIALSTVFGTTSLVSASDDLLSKLANHNNEAIEQCVKDINQSANDSLDTSSRLYHVGMCYFCIECDFVEDNGQIFQADIINISAEDNLELDESYQTAHKLIMQAAGLGNEEAFYGLAVLKYFSDLTKNKKTNTELSEDRVNAFKSKIKEEELSNKETQLSVDLLSKRTFKKMNKDGFSEQIHKYLLMAAKQGYLPAQFALSEVYFNGIGVAPDEVEAYAWAATALAQNPPFGSLRRDEKAVNLDDVELNKAEAIAEQYMKSYTNIFDRSSVTVMR